MSKFVQQAVKDPRGTLEATYNHAVDVVGNGATSAAGLLEIDWMGRRGLPTAPDGLYNGEAAPGSDEVEQKHSWALRTVDTLIDRCKKGLPLNLDASTLKAVMDCLHNATTKGINDRNMLLEKVLLFASRLEKSDPLSIKMNEIIIQFLYTDLPHPPSTFVGPPHTFRSADGAGNNVLVPTLGAAGQPYARSVAAVHPMASSRLPDPGLVFDTLLRREEPQDHPAGISSLLFAFATFIIHSLFKTRHTPGADETYINDTSSYLDLSPLYGNNQAEQDGVRLKDGRGRLYEDVYAETRLHMMPPAVAALLIIFCRNHNYIVEKLLQINERGTWVDPAKFGKDTQRLIKQDDELFNTARLVNCGFFMNIILTDYLSAILGLVREGSEWCLDPLQFIRTDGHDIVERGAGNACSVEFNLLYRWHAPISVPDTKWAEDLFKTLFPGTPWDDITIPEFAQKIAVTATADKDPSSWTLAGQARDPVTKRFSDDLLAKIIQDATATSAQAFRARGTPAVMRVVEMLSILEGRKWGVCSLNEFRNFLGLEAYDSFEKWNKNPDVADAAARLYGHIDNLELYVGLQAEEPKPVVPGAGLCPGYTISRGILADAVALTRGDRFLTTDFTPRTLTAFGYQDCARTTSNGSFGGTLGRLLFRHLPNHYHEGDVFAHFPFMTPTAMRKYLTELDKASQYNFDRPKRSPDIKAINSYEGVTAVFKNFRAYKTTYGPNIKSLTNGYGFFLAFDDPKKHNRDRLMMQEAMFGDHNAYRIYGEYFYEKIGALIREKSFTLSGQKGRCVDIVRDVINLTPIHFVSEFWSGLPIKTKDTPNAPHTEEEAYTYYMIVFTFIFLDILPETAWMLRQGASQASTVLYYHILTHLKSLKGSVLTNPMRLYDGVKHVLWGDDRRVHTFMRKLIDLAPDKPLEEIAYNIMACSVAAGANFAHQTVHVVNLYLQDEYKTEMEDIVKIATSDMYGPAEEKRLQAYVWEAMRIDPQAPGVFRDVAVDGVIQDGDKEIPVRAGDRLFLSIKNASNDPSIIGKDPLKIDINRDPSAYILFGGGATAMHNCLGDKMVINTMPYILRAIFRLKGLKRAPGTSGILQRFEQDLFGTKQYMYINDTGVQMGLPTPWPGSMVLQYTE